MEALGTFAVTTVLVVIGVFLMIAAYSEKEILLKLAVLGMFKIDPDHMGKTQRNVLFALGVFLVVVGAVLIVVEKLVSLDVL